MGYRYIDVDEASCLGQALELLACLLESASLASPPHGGGYGLMTFATFVAAVGLRVSFPERDLDHSVEVAPTVNSALVNEAAPFEIDPETLLGLDPVGRLVGISRCSARASADELISCLEQRPDCTALEWRVLLTRWAELDESGFRSAAVALIGNDAPFTEATVEEILAEQARKKVRERSQESIATLDPNDPLMTTAYEAWLRQDRVVAMHAIDALLDGDQKVGLMVLVAKVWASQNPEQALEWAIVQESEKSDLVNAVFAEMISNDPEKAWQMLKEDGQRVAMETKDQNDFVIESIRALVDRAAIRDPGEALD